MEYFLDSANLEKIKSVMERFPCDGVTTNPSILAREGGNPLETLCAIRAAIGGKLLFAQVTRADAAGMEAEAERLAALLGERLSVKIPATGEGLRAMKALAARGISVTATAVYTEAQALLAAKAGARYVAPYISHIDNLGIDSAEVVSRMARLLSMHAPETKVLAASFRVAEQINRVLLAGAGAVTVTAEMFDVLSHADGTDAELRAFRTNWSGAFGERDLLSFEK